MSDLINGREMLKRYQEDLCYGIACKECSMCTEDGGCRVEEWIDKFPSADRPQEWIPCNERVPKWKEHTDDMVLVCYADGSVRFNTFMNWQWVQGEPIAWMPLPKPWKGADDDI